MPEFGNMSWPLGDDKTGHAVFSYFDGTPVVQDGWMKGSQAIDRTNGYVFYNIGTTSTASWKRMDPAGMIDFTGQRSQILLADETVFALEILHPTSGQGFDIDTRTTTDGVVSFDFAMAPITIAGVSGSSYHAVSIDDVQLTTSTTTKITSLTGLSLRIAGAQIEQTGGAVTVTTASTMHVGKVAAGSSVTITNNYMISTGVATCFLTSAGVWTDAPSARQVKDDIVDADPDSIHDILRGIKPRTWKYKPEVMGNDFERQRFGIVSDELPECFRVPGVSSDNGGLSGTIIGSFALAALSLLQRENDELRTRLEALEAA